MPRAVFLAALGAALTFGLAGSAGPIEGIWGSKVQIERSSKLELDKKFKGGERACVILVGDHEPVVDLAIYVYDEQHNLVAKDVGGGDFCAAIWYPPRDATFHIVLENKGDEYNVCTLALK
jgi:hypothetical protein